MSNHHPYTYHTCQGNLIETIDKSYFARKLMLTTLKYHLPQVANRTRQQVEKHSSNGSLRLKMGIFEVATLQTVHTCSNWQPNAISKIILALPSSKQDEFCGICSCTSTSNYYTHPIFHVLLLRRSLNSKKVAPTYPPKALPDVSSTSTVILEAIL